MIEVCTNVLLVALVYGVLYSMFGARALPPPSHCFHNGTMQHHIDTNTSMLHDAGLGDKLTDVHLFVFTACSDRGTIFGLYVLIVLAMLFGAHTVGGIRILRRSCHTVPLVPNLFSH
jgi:hypothetical protein